MAEEGHPCRLPDDRHRQLTRRRSASGLRPSRLRRRARPPHALSFSQRQQVLDAVFSAAGKLVTRAAAPRHLAARRQPMTQLDGLARAVGRASGRRSSCLAARCRDGARDRTRSTSPGGASPCSGRPLGVDEACTTVRVAAAARAKAHALRQLVRAGADVDARTASRQTPLHLAASRRRPRAPLPLMLSARSAAPRDAAGRTTLHYVALAGLEAAGGGGGAARGAAAAAARPPPAAFRPRRGARAAARARATRATPTPILAAAALAAYRRPPPPRRRVAPRRARGGALASARALLARLRCLAFALAQGVALLFSPGGRRRDLRAALLAAAFGVLALGGGRCARSPSRATCRGGRRRRRRRAAARGVASASWCFACGLSRPMRAKHCRKCGRCVRGSTVTARGSTTASARATRAASSRRRRRRRRRAAGSSRSTPRRARRPATTTAARGVTARGRRSARRRARRRRRRRRCGGRPSASRSSRAAALALPRATARATSPPAPRRTGGST